jgi:hypothetical protein
MGSKGNVEVKLGHESEGAAGCTLDGAVDDEA